MSRRPECESSICKLLKGKLIVCRRCVIMEDKQCQCVVCKKKREEEEQTKLSVEVE